MRADTQDLVPDDGFGVYVHIPFCQARCTYCDFNTVTGMGPQEHEEYTRALLREWADEPLPAGRLVSIYFGGGTPSLVDPRHLAAVIRAIRARTGIETDAVEITVEVNPGTVDRERLARLRAAGVNRLSIGVQAWQNHHLEALNRVHSREDVVTTVALARAEGFTNLNCDAIYGLPGQTPEEWYETVDALIGLEVEHLSLYQLTVEPGTPLARGLAHKRVVLPPEDRVWDMADWAQARLAEAGFDAYEISNYARPGYHSRHNALYWYVNPYVALGAGAHSFSGRRRWWNVRAIPRYMTDVLAGQDPTAGEEWVSPEEEMREVVWLGLRLSQGVGRERFYRRFHLPLWEAFRGIWDRLQQRGLVEVTDDAIRLTPRGRDVWNQVSQEFLDAELESG